MDIWKVTSSRYFVYFIYFVALTYLIQEDNSQKVGLFFFAAICLSFATRSQAFVLISAMIVSELLYRYAIPEAFQVRDVESHIILMQKNEKLTGENKNLKTYNDNLEGKVDRRNATIASLEEAGRNSNLEIQKRNLEIDTKNNKLETAHKILKK